MYMYTVLTKLPHAGSPCMRVKTENQDAFYVYMYIQYMYMYMYMYYVACTDVITI